MLTMKKCLLRYSGIYVSFAEFQGRQQIEDSLAQLDPPATKSAQTLAVSGFDQLELILEICETMEVVI